MFDCYNNSSTTANTLWWWLPFKQVRVIGVRMLNSQPGPDGLFTAYGAIIWVQFVEKMLNILRVYPCAFINAQ